MSIRVLIADDHPVVRDGLRFSIERSRREIEVVGEAADGTEVLKLAEHQPVDVFVIDITMPHLNGLDATRELLRRRATAKVIILSLHDSQAFVQEAVAAGARGYLTKETASRNVVDAVCEVHAGHFYLSPNVTGYVMETRSRAADSTRSSRAAALTLQERKVLQLIAEGRTTKEIAASMSRALETVRTHRKNLMTKLGLHKQTDLVRFAVKEGIAKL